MLLGFESEGAGAVATESVQGFLPFFAPLPLRTTVSRTPCVEASGAPELEPAPPCVAPSTMLPRTLQDVLDALERERSSCRRQTEMKSAIRRMGVVLRRNLNDISADPTELRKFIAAAPPACVGMTKERWSRVRSLVLAALREQGLDMMPGRDVGGVSLTWRAMRERLPTRAQQHGLSRFMSFCSRQGVEPEDVTSETFDEFDQALRTRSLKDKPDAIYRGSVRHWDRAVQNVPGWPQRQIGLEKHVRFYSFEWSSFPPTLAADVEAFLASSGNQDVLDDDYAKPVAPSTVALRRRQLQQIASMIVLSGTPIEQVENLAVIVEPGKANAALRYQRDRDGKVTTSLGQKAWLLCVIARHWVHNPAHAAALRDLARRVSVKKAGMTERNSTRLRQFDHRPNVHAFVDLPHKIFRQAASEKLGTLDEARRVMWALAMEIELLLPMRVGNLTSLEHNRHILTLGAGRARDRHLLLPGCETKNGEGSEAILPEASAKLLDIYLERYRPRLCATPSPFLFPAPGGGRRNVISFSRGLSGFVARETGLKIHVHLFRHFAGKMSLEADPNDWETPRRLLGHKSPETTRRFYVEQKSTQAIKRYDGTLERLRDEAARLAARRRPSSKRRTPR